jgi:hypothetical protein
MTTAYNSDGSPLTTYDSTAPSYACRGSPVRMM